MPTYKVRVCVARVFTYEVRIAAINMLDAERIINDLPMDTITEYEIDEDMIEMWVEETEEVKEN